MAGKDERQTKLNRFRGTYGKLSTDKVVRVKTTEGEYSYHLVFGSYSWTYDFTGAYAWQFRT